MYDRRPNRDTASEKEKRMPLYRILCVGRTSAALDGKIPKLVKKLADDVVNGGGLFQNVESLGNRRLAFKFRQKQGYVRTFLSSRFFLVLSSRILSL